MATKQSIIKHALIRAGVLAVDDTPSGEQNSVALRVLESTHAAMLDNGDLRWSLDEIPLEVADALASVLAKKIALDFGVSSERLPHLNYADIEARRLIAQNNAIDYVGCTGVQAF